MVAITTTIKVCQGVKEQGTEIFSRPGALTVVKIFANPIQVGEIDIDIYQEVTYL